MGWELVAEGSVWELGDVAFYEDQLEERSYNLLELALSMPVGQDVADAIEQQLRGAGVEGVKVTTSSPQLNIYFRKGFPWLAVIAAVIAVSAVIIWVISWRLLTYVGAMAPWAVPWLALAGIAGATLITVALVRRKT